MLRSNTRVAPPPPPVRDGPPPGPPGASPSPALPPRGVQGGGHSGGEPRRHIVTRQLSERDVPDPPEGLELAAAPRAVLQMCPDFRLPRGVEPPVEKVLKRGAEVTHVPLP